MGHFVPGTLRKIKSEKPACCKSDLAVVFCFRMFLGTYK